VLRREIDDVSERRHPIRRHRRRPTIRARRRCRLPPIFGFDRASLVLTAYNRIRGRTGRGNLRVASSFRSLFISI
jgi:hypothetical protein